MCHGLDVFHELASEISGEYGHDAPSCAKTCPLTFLLEVFFSSPSKPAGENPDPFAAAAARNSPFKRALGQAPRTQFNP